MVGRDTEKGLDGKKGPVKFYVGQRFFYAIFNFRGRHVSRSIPLEGISPNKVHASHTRLI